MIFSVPVSLTFPLSDAEVLGLDTSFVATQHADGLWYLQPGQTRDAIAKTISVTAQHFSDWTVLQTLYLKPNSLRLRTGASGDFEPFILYDPEQDELLANPFPSEVTVMMPTHFSHQLTSETARHWAVNNVNGGAATVGTVSQSGDNGHYTAPTNKPNPSTVYVTLTVELGNRKVIASASVDVYDQERWTGTSTIDFIDGTSLTANWTFVQQGDPVDNTYTLDVEGGNVNFTPLTMQNGCPLTVDPVSHVISPGEGSMTVEYSLASGPESPMVSGGGATVWPATYTLHCPPSDQRISSVVDGEWWPIFGPPTPVEANNGGVDIPISTLLATGTVHLQRQ